MSTVCITSYALIKFVLQYLFRNAQYGEKNSLCCVCFTSIIFKQCQTLMLFYEARVLWCGSMLAPLLYDTHTLYSSRVAAPLRLIILSGVLVARSLYS